jgi:predicted RNase H-like nuclease
VLSDLPIYLKAGFNNLTRPALISVVLCVFSVVLCEINNYTEVHREDTEVHRGLSNYGFLVTVL